MEIVIFVLLILSILIGSAIASGSEAAILSISYPKVKELANNSKSNAAKKLLYIKENLQDYITTIVVLNNFINIVGSMYVGVLASIIFGEVYLGIVSGILTFLIILFSEIIPKVYGDAHSEKIALFIAIPLYYLAIILKPIVVFLNFLVNFFVKTKKHNQISEGEIKEMALLGEKEGSINSYESDMIRNVFEMDDTTVYDIMVPKNEVVVIKENANYNQIINIAQKSGFTRFPIISENDGEVIGIINIKDMLKYHNREDKFSISKILRPTFFVPESMKIYDLQERFKKERTHMAIIVNEHGDFVGIVTLEDIIEELLGEIEDEFDKEEKSPIVKITENKYHIDASADLRYINEKLGIDLFDEDAEYSTLNGFIIYKFGKIPKVNDKMKFEKFSIRIIKASKKKVLEAELILYIGGDKNE
jgi:CBS domain containing-hemolysin-like protein